MVGLALSAILVARRGVVLLGGADGNALDAADVTGLVRVGSRQLWPLPHGLYQDVIVFRVNYSKNNTNSHHVV